MDYIASIQSLEKLLMTVSLKQRNYDGSSLSVQIRELNQLARVIRELSSEVSEIKYATSIVKSMQYVLMSNVQEIRAGGIRVLRYILMSEEVLDVMLKHCIDLLIMRSLELSNQREVERMQALRFIQQVIVVAPKKFPASLAAILVSITTGDPDISDSTTLACTGLLCQLTLANVPLAVGCGAVRALSRRLLQCQNAQLDEGIVLILLNLYNHSNTRRYTRLSNDLMLFLAPVTDIHYEHEVTGWEDAKKINFNTGGYVNTHNAEIQMRVECCCLALSAILKSWPGLMCLVSTHQKGSEKGKCPLAALVEVLPLASDQAKTEVLEMFFTVFQLRVPTRTDQHSVGLASISSQEPLSSWALDEGFVVEEARVLLPPVTAKQIDLVKCYYAMLLSVLIELGLFTSLSKVAIAENKFLSVRATILLGELTYLANRLLPGMFYQDIHSLPEIVQAAMDFSDLEKQNHVSDVIKCLEELHEMRKKGSKPSSLYLKELQKRGLHRGPGSLCLMCEVDEVALMSMIKNSQVLSTKEYQQWNWTILRTLFELNPLNYRRVEEGVKQKFFNRLYNFYKPKNKLFSAVSYSSENARKYSSIGCQFVTLLSNDENELAIFLSGLITDIAAELNEIVRNGQGDILSPFSIENTLSRDYMLFLGCVSHQNPEILALCKVYGSLLSVCEADGREDLHKLILSSLDFPQDRYCRSILTKLLTSSSFATRLYATKHLRVLLRTRAPFFKSWGIELLTMQLYDVDEEVALEAVDILDEACEDESYLLSLAHFNPALVHLGEKGVSFLTRFFSTSKGFSRMKNLGYLEGELQRWHDGYNDVYVNVVEYRLSEAFTTFKKTKDDDFVKKSINSMPIHYTAYLPVHLYGQMVKHSEGCEVLQKCGHIEEYARFLRNNIHSSSDPLKLKAALWALGHTGTSVEGLDLLMDEGVIHDFIRLVESHDTLSVRGTCYYVLCLIACTSRGAAILDELGWVSIKEVMQSDSLSVGSFSRSLTISPSTSQEIFFNGAPEPDPMTDSGTLRPPLPSIQTKKRHSLSLNLKRNLSAGKESNMSDLQTRQQGGSVGNLHDETESDSVSKRSSSSVTSPLTASSIPSSKLLSAAVPYITISRSTGRKLRKASRKEEGPSSPNPISGVFHLVGICLPKVKESILQVPPTDYIGSTSDHVSVLLSDISGESHLVHDQSRCIQCFLTKSHECHLTKEELRNVDGGNVVMPSEEEREAVRKEVLRIAYSLSNDLSSSGNRQNLKMLFTRFPWIAQDVCLYSQVLHLLSIYPYNVNHRRYIHNLFRNCKFHSIYVHQQCSDVSLPQPNPPSLDLYNESGSPAKQVRQHSKNISLTSDSMSGFEDNIV